MDSSKGLSKLKSGQFFLLSILLQLLPFLLFLVLYGFHNCISYGRFQACVYEVGNYTEDLVPYINYFVIVGVIMINAIHSTTRSELLATAMHVILILFIYLETEYVFLDLPLDYTLFILSVFVTFPTRMFMESKAPLD